MNAPPITKSTFLISLSAMSAAWMVGMATRYYAMQAGDINGALGVGVDDGSWLSTTYAICEPIGVLIGTWLGIVFSLRRLLLMGIIGFLLGSALPLLAPTYNALLISRAITGLAGGVIMPQAIVILLQAWGPPRFPIPLVIFLSASTAGPLAGGMLGAWAVDTYGWSAIFWLAFPFGALSLILGFRHLKRAAINWRPLVHADLAGAISLSAAMGFFSCAVSQGDRLRWFQTPLIPICFTASALCLAVFVKREWRSVRHPILWVKMYGRWNVKLALLSVIPLTFAISMSGVIIPAAMAQLHGFRPEQVSDLLWSALWPQPISFALCALLLLKKKCELRAMIIAGMGTVALGALFDLRITSDWQEGELFIGQVLQGIGIPMLGIPLLMTFIADLRPPAESVPAAAVFNLSRVLSGTIATAWASTSLRLNSQSKFADLLANTGLYPDGRGTTLATLTAKMARLDADPLHAKARAVAVLANTTRRQAAVLGISDTLAVLALIFLAGCLLVLLMAEPGSGKILKPHETRP